MHSKVGRLRRGSGWGRPGALRMEPCPVGLAREGSWAVFVWTVTAVVSPGGEQEADAAPESGGDATCPGPDTEDDALAPTAPRSCGPSTSVSSSPPSSPQLADFGLERYLVAAPAGRSHAEGREALTPPAPPSPAKVRETTCAPSADDFECVTPKLQHLSISRHSASLNPDLPVGPRSVEGERYAASLRGAVPWL